MDFSIPTTKEAMYATLMQIFYYYRVRREGYPGVTLNDLKLTRLEFTRPSVSELTLKAQTLLDSKHYEFRTKYVEQINNELSSIDAKIVALPDEKTARENKVNDDIDASVQKINLEIAKNGLQGSSVAIDKLTELELERIRLLADISDEYSQLSTDLYNQRQILVEQLDNAQEYCASIEEREIQAKVDELKDEQDKLEREVFKYNNGLDEKEQRYANTILQTNANLNLRFLEIRSGEYTKDELIEMGYYEDVIRCVCGYYDTLPATTAFQEFDDDKKVITYLDDYYESIYYIYKQRALS